MKKSELNNEKKALIVTTVASTLDQFCMDDINILLKSHKVYVAANFNSGNNTSIERVEEFKFGLQRMGIIVIEVNFNRNPFSKRNYNAYKGITKLIESETFDIIHCHTPVAAMLARLAVRKVRKKGMQVIYTAHGFHFYKGAPLKNWVLYYPVERWLARYTDVLVTINKEDYVRAQKFKAKSIEYVPGVGIDTKKHSEVLVNKKEKRCQIGVPEDAFIVLSVGELNKNKNHKVIIKAIAKLNNKNIYYIICGQGSMEYHLTELANELGVKDQVILLGFRNDISEICKVADIFAFPSFREGLSVSLMEAMASGLPIICSLIRGNTDLLEDGIGGYMNRPENVEAYAISIEKLLSNPELRKSMGKRNAEAVQKYDKTVVKEEMIRLYKGITTV